MQDSRLLVIAVFAALAIAIWLAVTASDEPDPAGPAVTVADVAGAPGQFVERTVTLTGRYDRTQRSHRRPLPRASCWPTATTSWSSCPALVCSCPRWSTDSDCA